jgi:hypothetical protein
MQMRSIFWHRQGFCFTPNFVSKQQSSVSSFFITSFRFGEMTFHQKNIGTWEVL